MSRTSSRPPTRSRPSTGPGAAGFTLFEMLVAIAVMGLVMGVLGQVTGRWMPDWSRVLLRVERTEQVAIVLDRLAADLAAAEPIAAGRTSPRPLFEGDETGVTFVRPALGPNTPPGLEVVRIVETADSRGPVLVRLRARYVPPAEGDDPFAGIAFADPVVLLRAPWRVGFAFAGGDEADRRWQPSWVRKPKLPGVVRITVRDLSRAGGALETATRVRIEEAGPKPPPEGDE
ncbi:PulJ/GspJ family protein [Rhodoplanes azumiensis]|uniref:Type II secretion system protein J n=1 Tax=Rhodoplanes azumiensis TaxID=1897628 RepID=A0ABW5ANK6_9BRAD